ncbi:MAG: ABC transporter ATP-binding protein [Spirosomataceae bacterium]
MIHIENLTKRFGTLEVLKNVNLHIEPNSVVAVIGPNGSGKTTLIKCLLGMVIPDAGSISVQQHPITANGAYRQHIGYMPQIGRYPDNMKIAQLFEMMTDLRRDTFTGELDEELIEAFELRTMFHKTMRTLSGGTKQKVSAALAFLFNPSLLILDEPTAGLDPLSCEILKEKIHLESTKGKCVLITSHVMSDLDEIATHVLYLFEGTIQFYKSLQQLKAETNEYKLGRIIAQLMREKKTLIPVDKPAFAESI